MSSFADHVADVLLALQFFAWENWLFLVVVAIAVAIRWRIPKLKFEVRDGIAITIVMLVAFASCVGAAALHGIAVPEYHDDYTNLLAADMIAHGHLSYPTHPMSVFFETLHVLQSPRYASPYPPAQAMMFALGIVLFHLALAGAWISVVLAAAAIWWALRVWTSPSLALLGGILVSIHPTMLGWGETYHGAPIAAAAGAIMLAAAGRLIDEPTRLNFALICFAAVTLAFSRPYEGLVYTIGIALMVIIATRGRWRSVIATTPIGIAILIAGVLLVGAYNHAITGNARVLPHSLYDARYVPAPNFLWQAPRSLPQYPNAEMARVFRIAYFNHYNRLRGPGGWQREVGKKIQVIDSALFGNPANRLANTAWLLNLVPLVALVPLLIENRRARWLLIVFLIFCFAPFSIVWWMQLHYLAPAAALAATLMMLLIARLAEMPRGGVLAIVVIAYFLINATTNWVRFARSGQPGFEPQRQRIARTVLAHGGKHLIFVAPDVYDSVYNAADIDQSPIVWAHDLGDDRDRALIAYFHDRHVWRLQHQGTTFVISSW